MPCIIEDLDKSTMALDKQSWCVVSAAAESYDKSCKKHEVIRKHSQVSPATSDKTDPARAVLPPASIKNLLVNTHQIQSPLVTSLSITDLNRTKRRIHIFTVG